MVPPSTTRHWPVMKDDRFDSRKTRGPAISSGRPNLRMGTPSETARASISAMACAGPAGCLLTWRGVAMMSGATVFSRMPRGAHSSERLRASEARPALAAP